MKSVICPGDARDEFMKVLQEKAIVRGFEIMMVDTKGKQFSGTVNASTLRDRTGRKTGTIFMFPEHKRGTGAEDRPGRQDAGA